MNRSHLNSEVLIHTTPHALSKIPTSVTNFIISSMGDCFYGWGEERDLSTCVPHVVLEVEPDDMYSVTQSLWLNNIEFVVTDRGDWGIVINTYPQHTSGAHTH